MASFSAKAIAVATLLISTPLTLDYLGVERFGLWMTVSSLIAVLGFADLGIGNGLVNVIAEANGRDDRELARRAVTSSIVLLTIIGLVLAFVFALVYPILDWSHLLNIVDRQSAAEAGKAVVVLVFCLAISLPLLTAQRVQLGYQEGLQANLWQAAGSIFMLIGILLAIRVHAGLPWLILAAVGGPAVAMGLNWVHQFFFSRLWLLPKISCFDWAMGRRMAMLGMLWMWYQLMVFVGTAADNLIISYMLGAGYVGSYAIMSKLLSGVLIAQMFTAPLWSAFAEALERGDLEWVRKAFRRTLLLFSALGVIGAFIMGVGSFWIVRVWVGAEMVPTPLLALGFAIWSVVMSLFGAISVLMANNRFLKQLTWLVTIAALSSFGLKLILAPVMGVSGIIWASVLGYALACILGLLITRSTWRTPSHGG